MIVSMTTKTLLFIILIIVLTACNLAESTPVAVIQATRPSVNIAQVATIPPQATTTRLIREIPSNTPAPASATPEPTRSAYECNIEASGEHIQHTVNATLDYASKRVTVAQEIRYRNESEVALEEIVFDVQANDWNGAFGLENILLNGADTFYSLDRNRMTVRLPSPLNPGCVATVQIDFVLAIPRIGIDSRAARGFFGYSERQVNLGLWLPTVAPRIGNQWLLYDPYIMGEQTVLEQADWDIRLTIQNGDNIVLAAPGIVEDLGENQWRIIHNSSRDLTISLSPNFRVRRQTLPSGVQIELYHFSDTERSINGGTVDGAAHALDVASRAAEQYESLFGAYPYERMLIIQGDFPDGMEFSGIVFVSTNWFYGFEGGVQNYLTLITVHEVAHQWWYASVGNDAANEPWLDEAFSTYSEYIFYEEYYPAQRDWWWSFRVAWYNPQGAVDSTVYDFESPRDYINGIYLRGAQMLHNVREDIGTQAFFDLLAAYAQAGNGQIGTSALFWSLLTEEQLELTRDTRATFFADLEVGDG
jgi:Peptidase family M1 domain